MKRFTRQAIAVAAALLLSFSFASVATAQGKGAGEQGSANGKPFQTLQSHIDVLAADLDAVVNDFQGQIDALVQSQADQDEVIARIQTAVRLLQQRVAANEGDIAALQAADAFLAQLIGALDSRLTDLEGRVTDNENDIAAIILADQTTQMLIAAIQNQITNLGLRIDANDGDITALQNQVASLNATVGSLQIQLAQKQDRVNGVCSPGSSIRVINANGSVVCEVDSTSAGVGTFQTTRVTNSQRIPGAAFVAGQLSLSATCPSTHRIVGGGYTFSVIDLVIDADPRLIQVTRTRPSTLSNNWNVHVVNDNVHLLGCCQTDLFVYATCGRVQ